MKDYYRILGLSEKATTNEVIRSFRILAKKFHPDINKSPDAPNKFREVYEAYEILKSEQKRLQYDRLLQTQNEMRTPQYSYANNQNNSKNSNNSDQFSGWKKQAEENAHTYSNLKYKDFIKQALRGTAKFILISILEIFFYILGLIEFFSIFFICFLLPVKSSDISPTVSIINVFAAISFGIYYYLFYYQESCGVLIQIVEKEKRSFLKISIYFLMLFYTIAIWNYSIYKVKERNEIAEYAFHQKASNIESHLNYLLGNFSGSESSINNFIRHVIVVDMNKNCLADIYRTLPESIITYNYDSIRTLIQIWETKIKVYKYTDGAFGYQQICRFKIIDFKSSVVLAEDEIKGSMPPNSKKYSGDVSGSSPMIELKELIIKNVKD